MQLGHECFPVINAPVCRAQLGGNSEDKEGCAVQGSQHTLGACFFLISEQKIPTRAFSHARIAKRSEAPCKPAGLCFVTITNGVIRVRSQILMRQSEDLRDAA